MARTPVNLFLCQSLLTAGFVASSDNKFSPTGRNSKMTGKDIKLADLYHPWADIDSAPLAPMNSRQDTLAAEFFRRFRAGDSVEAVVNLMELISTENVLGMTLGEEKGNIMESAIFDEFKDQSTTDLVILEFGSHIGDGSLRLINAANKVIAKNDKIQKCIVVSFESNPEWLSIGANIVRHVLSGIEASTGRTNHCQYIPMTLMEDISHSMEYLKEHLGITSVHAIMMDHVHAKFLTDLKIIREKGLIKQSALVIADNALKYSSVMMDFIWYMRKYSKKFKLAKVDKPYPDEVLVALFTGIQNNNAHDSSEL